MEDLSRIVAPIEPLPAANDAPARGLIEYLHRNPVAESALGDVVEVPHLPALTMAEEMERRIWCRRKLRMVPLGKCLDDHLDHTALGVTVSDCTDCPQGAWNRRCFARS